MSPTEQCPSVAFARAQALVVDLEACSTQSATSALLATSGQLGLEPGRLAELFIAPVDAHPDASLARVLAAVLVEQSHAVPLVAARTG
jgi:hypothetical protein